MIRSIIFESSPVEGDDMRRIVEIFPECLGRFTPRKHYDEYYFEETEVKLSLNKLESLSKEYTFSISCFSLIIDNKI